MPGFDKLDNSTVRPLSQRTTNPLFGEEYASPANVTIGTVTVEESSNFVAQTVNTLYTDFVFKTKVHKDNRLYYMGQTSPNAFQENTATVVQLAAPTLLWQVDWTACRFGAIPQIPEPTPASANSVWVLLDEQYEPGMIVLGPSGSKPLYRISGTFLYGSLRPNARTILDLRFSTPPWISTTTFTRTIAEANMTRSLFGLES